MNANSNSNDALVYESNADGTYIVVGVKDKNCNSIIIPSTHLEQLVTDIGDNAFTACKNLTDITATNNIISIGDSIFANCISLEEIIIPYSVTSIGIGAFKNCTSLTYVIFEDTDNWFVTTIENASTATGLTFTSSTVLGNRLTEYLCNYYLYKGFYELI